MNRLINSRLNVNNCFKEFQASSSSDESTPDNNKENSTSRERSLPLWSNLEIACHENFSIPVSVKQAKLCFENLATRNNSSGLTAQIQGRQRRFKLPENTQVRNCLLFERYALCNDYKPV